MTRLMIICVVGLMPVIILQGSDHEMGIQYGQQAGKYLLARKESSWARALQTMSREKITRELKARQWHIKKNSPEAIAMMRGMAEGAKESGFDIDFIDVLLSAYDCIFATNREFMHLRLDDSRYGTLNDLFSIAKTEYYQGLAWSNKARLTNGDQALFDLAQAATAFTRAQAHARQVYNELVPPASNPHDLGLKPYEETSWSKEYPGEVKK